jgi:hypothetical protein
MLDNNKRCVKGIISYHLYDTIALSPLRSTFGSYIFSLDILEEELNAFVDFTEARLMEKGVKTIILKNSPAAYSPDQHEILHQVLFKHRYNVQLEEISSIIAVSDRLFESQLHRSEKKRLRKCRESNLVFTMVSLDHLPGIYDFLMECKEKKGYEISMTLEELMRVSAAFPDHFFLTQVTLNDERIAANISIKVNESVLYNFYHDHNEFFNLLSPVVLLNEGLYQFCQQNGFKMLDLGTSTSYGIINSSLLDFKLRLGAQPSRKLTFVKNIS